LVRPSGITSTSWNVVAAQCRDLGLSFDTWQDGAGRLILAQREDGSYAATVGGVVLSWPRQVGKTYLIGAICVALCLLRPGTLVLWTAHHGKTSGETFRAMRAMVKRQAIAPRVFAVRLGSGNEGIEFRNGSRILFGAREHGFGLGFAGVTVLIFDEAQRLTQRAVDDMVPTMNTATNPLVFYIGTPPRPDDPGEIFRRLRAEALSVEVGVIAGGDPDNDTLYIELAADVDAPRDVLDWVQVAKANPSFPHRVPRAAEQRMWKHLGPESFRREGLGIWDDDNDPTTRAIPPVLWDLTGVREAPLGLDEGVRSLAVAFNLDGSRQAVAGAVKHDAGVHVEIVGAHTGSRDAGVRSLVQWLCHDPEHPARWRDMATIVMCGRAGATVLHDALRTEGVPPKVLHVASTPDYTDACAAFLSAVLDGSVTHPRGAPGDVLDAAAAVCDRKARGINGAWGWVPTTPDGDATPLEAASLAYRAATTTKRHPGRKAVLI
jgi:hypothetical protein